MNVLLVATMLFITSPFPTLEQPALTVYAEYDEPVEVVEIEEECFVVEYEIEAETEPETEEEPESCMHNVYTDIEDLGDGYFVGTCECGESIPWYEFPEEAVLFGYDEPEETEEECIDEE